MKVLDDFKKHSPPQRRVSKLKSFKKEILELYNDGYRVEQIQEFLAQNSVNVTVDAINKFKRNLTSKNFSLQTLSSSEAAKKSLPHTKVANESTNSKAINAYMAKMQKIAQKD